MDWSLFHFLNGLLVGHPFLADGLEDFSLWSVPTLAVATLGLWLFARPGTLSPWKLATLSAFASAGFALLTNQAISHIWSRERPTIAHPGEAHLFFVAPSGDPSFPSDHAAAAFAIAFAIFFLSRPAGAAFLVVAAAISLDRIFIGLHYPGDVGGGLLVGLLAAGLVHTVGRRPLLWTAALLSKLTDPLLRPVWQLVEQRLPRMSRQQT
jgi:undecaprenyl-diphosphatase